MSFDASQNDAIYEEFYEKLGKYYPESKRVHNKRDPQARFQAVLLELRPFALRKATLLDVGCNDGVYTIPYVMIGGKADGIDISESLVIKAYNRAKMLIPNSTEYSFKVMDIQAELNYTLKYDVILMSEVLEHLNHPERAIVNAYNLLKEGGHFLLTCPSPLNEILNIADMKYVWNLFGHKLKESQIIDSNKNLLSEYGIKDYLYRHDGYYPLGLKAFIEKFGFRCVKFYTIGFGKRSFMIPYINRFEFFLRKVPLLNLFGSINVQMFKKPPFEDAEMSH